MHFLIYSSINMGCYKSMKRNLTASVLSCSFVKQELYTTRSELDPMQKSSPVVPKPSATLVLVRDSGAGLEVFLQQRHPDIPFLGGAHVFPGGKVEAVDNDPKWQAFSDLDDKSASETLDLTEGGLAYWVAAIRETYEESGILLLEPTPGKTLDAEILNLWPNEVPDVFQLCQRYSLNLSTPQLTYYLHWITPEHMTKRFDTRFFIARAPTGQEGSHDGKECVDSIWITPEAAMERKKQGTMALAPPTFFTLKHLLEIRSVDELILTAQNNKPTAAILPVFRNNRLLFPGDPGYDETEIGSV